MTAPRKPLAEIFLPRIGLRRIEARALRCLERCRKRLGWKEIPLPVPVETCIEAALGIRFGVADLSHLGDDVLGAAYLRSGEILISDKALTHEGRYRFTCAHELGHFMMHAGQTAPFTDREVPDFRLHSKVEWQANSFAASFLMPSRIFEQEMLRICERSRLDAQHCLSELMLPTCESVWLWRTLFLPSQAERFHVSKAALLVRCSNLRLASCDDRPLLPDYVRNELLAPAAAAAGEFTIIEGRPVRAQSLRTGRS